MDIPENSINEILENNPSQGTLHVILPLLRESGKINLVIRECLKAIARFPHDYTLQKILAEAYLEDGRLVEAEAEFDNVIRGIKGLAESFKHQADIFMRQERVDEAVECLGHYVSFFPENDESATLLDELIAAADVPEEIPLPAESSEEEYIEEVTAGEEAAETIPVEEEHIEEVTAEEEFVEAVPVDEEITESIFPGEEDIEEINAVEEAFEELSAEEEPVEAFLEPEEPDTFPEIVTVTLAETYFDQGQLEEARDIYEKLAEKNPEDEAVRSRLDEITGLMAEPEELFQELIEEEPEIIEQEMLGTAEADNSIRRKKEKVITALDRWLSNVKKFAGEEPAAN